MLPGRILEEDERLAAATRNVVELSGDWKEERDFFGTRSQTELRKIASGSTTQNLLFGNGIVRSQLV